MSTVEIRDDLRVPAGVPEVLEQFARDIGAEVQRVWLAEATQRNAPKSYVAGVRTSTIFVRGKTDTHVEVVVRNAWGKSGYVDAGHDGFHLPSQVSWPTPETQVGRDGRMWVTVPLGGGTFRRLYADSEKWHIPAREGLHLPKVVLEEIARSAR